MEYRVRATSRRKKGKSSAATAIVVLLSIGLIALIIVLSPIGTFLSDSLIRPVMSCFGTDPEDKKIVSALQTHDESIQSATAEPTAKPVPVKNVLTIDAIPFYILQMGVYTDRSDAIKHGEEIALFGAGGTVFQDGSVYRVFAAAYGDEESVRKVQSQVNADGFEATPYITDRSGLRISLEGDPEAIRIVNDAIPLLASVPKTLTDLSLAFDKQTCSEKELKQQLNELLEQCGEKISAMMQIGSESIGPILDLLKNYQQSISTFLKNHDTINVRSDELKRLQLSAITDYILFFQQE